MEIFTMAGSNSNFQNTRILMFTGDNTNATLKSHISAMLLKILPHGQIDGTFSIRMVRF